ncbi:ATP-dependent DNA helicase [Sphaerochaeta halotolerans]|uniref:ATP-dependent DNA helicase n=1 Tax=Sphaerochaeta halotolerans TaxID=2293840 RepID=A0A372MEH4_9SPIR|nr:ATP-dependent DNA helicase [Sphaerochaeta halotolerans]MBG0766832.1 ATP-dependent DNA helicase [Spirochaetaceae bacterium]MXI86299.1 ATP-dependent DNA helicase [Sphaerochaeta halotolerans]RFU93853.1 ATP-dependent DNA helicase [Sphaerochaeta halotolerans]
MTKHDIYHIFDKDGLLEQNFPSYEYREGQLNMADLVRESFERNAIAAIEAGTGIGKSFAYLAVALYSAMQSPDERTVIATSTINLQKQLYEKDIPMLFKFLGLSCKIALAVGRGNYLCINRYMQAKADSGLLAQDPANELYQIGQWIKESETGLFADFPGRLSGELKGEICSDGDLCQNHACAYFRDCFYFKAKAKAKDAKIIISNHHLLFTDAQSRFISNVGYEEEMILPPFNRLIIDEAHNIESNATEYFTEVYDSQQLLRQISKIQRSGRFRGKSLLEQLGEYSTEADIIDRIQDDILLLTQNVGTLDQYLLGVFQKNDYQPVLIKAEHQGRLQQFVEAATSVSQASGRLAAKINTFLEQNKAPQELESKINELKVRGTRIAMMSEVLTKFCNFTLWKDEVHWFNAESYGTHRQVQVCITPLSIAPLLVEAVFKKLDTVVCTSATLDLNDEFAFWSTRVGLPYDEERPFLKGAFSSPFDYRNQLLLLTPSDAPLYSKDREAAYEEYLAQTIMSSVLSAGGGVLVLFTSYSMLKKVHQQLSETFEKEGLTLLCQGEYDRYTLLNRFISEQDSVLFATSSFWEGVDAPGETLRMVIIVKLPFTVPSDPVFKARCEAIDANGGSGFYQLALQSATMKLKQGFGRLLRSACDRGVVIILDSRVVSKNYGMYMIRSLPESYHPESETTGLSDKVENFLYGR